MDPSSATPLLTFSVFNDYAQTKDVALVRCDLVNRNLGPEEGRKAVQALLENYRNDEDFESIEVFNHRPSEFDFDDHISKMNERWKQDRDTVTMN